MLPPGSALRHPVTLLKQVLDLCAIRAMLKHMLNQGATLDRVFQALADPSRRLMVERLSQGQATVSELGRPLEMSLAAVVQHVQVLEASGLVRTQKVGRKRTCSIEPAVLRGAEQWITERRTAWERRLDQLGDFLAESSRPEDNDRARENDHD